MKNAQHCGQIWAWDQGVLCENKQEECVIDGRNEVEVGKEEGIKQNILNIEE